MQARISKSKKWTNLPQELMEQIEGVFSETFKKRVQESEKAQFSVAGFLYPDEVILDVALVRQGTLKQAHFLASQSFNSKKQNLHELIFFAVDCIATFFDEFLEKKEDDFDLPREWKKFEVEGKEVFLRYSVENQGLEAEADALLGLSPAEDSLVQGEDESEDVDLIKKSLGIDEDD